MDRMVERISLQQEQECSMDAAKSEYLENPRAGLLVKMLQMQRITQKECPYFVNVLQDPSQYGSSISSIDWHSPCVILVFMGTTLQAFSFSMPFKNETQSAFHWNI